MQQGTRFDSEDEEFDRSIETALKPVADALYAEPKPNRDEDGDVYSRLSSIADSSHGLGDGTVFISDNEDGVRFKIEIGDSSFRTMFTFKQWTVFREAVNQFMTKDEEKKFATQNDVQANDLFPAFGNICSPEVR